MKVGKKTFKQERIVNFHNCNLCPFRTKSLISIISHLRRHRLDTSEKVFSCSEKSPELYKCPDCDFQTYLVVKINEHVNFTHLMPSTSGNETFELNDSLKCCNYSGCDFKTSSVLVFMKHILNCTKNQSGEVNICSGNYTADKIECYYQSCTSVKSEIKVHKSRKHTATVKERWYQCTYCPHKSKRNLKVHIIAKHTTPEEIKWFHCDQCPFKTKRKDHLKQHQVHKHTAPEEKNWYNCKLCSFKTVWKSNLKIHELKHTGAAKAVNVQWFDCVHCPYKTKHKPHLKRHVTAKHTVSDEIEWFHCDHCPFKSKRKHNLKQHQLQKHTAPEKRTGIVII